MAARQAIAGLLHVPAYLNDASASQRVAGFGYVDESGGGTSTVAGAATMTGAATFAAIFASTQTAALTAAGAATMSAVSFTAAALTRNAILGAFARPSYVNEHASQALAGFSYLDVNSGPTTLPAVATMTGAASMLAASFANILTGAAVMAGAASFRAVSTSVAGGGGAAGLGISIGIGIGLSLGSGPSFAGPITVSAQATMSAGSTMAADATPAVYLPTIGTPTVAVGLVKMIAAYAGPAIQVTRSTDSATQDIGFIGQGLDTAAADSFAGSATLTVSKFYDQTGNGNDLLPGTYSGHPPLLVTQYGPPYMIFNGAAGVTFFTIPATVTFNRNNSSVWTVVRDLTTAVTGHWWTFGSANDFALQNYTSSFGSQPIVDGTLRAVVPNDYSTTSLSSKTLLGLNSNGTNLTIYRDERSATATAASSLVLSAGGTIGFGATGYRADLFAWLVYPFALSSPSVLSLKTNLQAMYNTNSWTPTLNVAFQGDSKTYGVAVPNHRTLARQAGDLLGSAWATRSYGVSGQTVQSVQGAYQTPNNRQVSGATNIVHLYEGTNDIGTTGATAAQVWGYYQTFVGNALTGGGWNYVTVSSITWRSGLPAAKELQLELLNAMIQQNIGSLFDGLADFASMTALGTAGAPNTAYLPDGLHENEAAYALEMSLLVPALQNVATTGGRSPCTVFPIVSGSTVHGSVLSCSTGTWLRSPLSYAYQWQWADTGAPISGATSATYTTQTSDVGHTILCNVAATNAVGASNSAPSNTTAVVT